jgi:hypothetical protein
VTIFEELERVFDHFPTYHMRILLRDFNAKLGREEIFKPTNGNDRLHKEGNDNDVRIVNSATLTNLVVKSKLFPHRNTNYTPGPHMMQ